MAEKVTVVMSLLVVDTRTPLTPAPPPSVTVPIRNGLQISSLTTFFPIFKSRFVHLICLTYYCSWRLGGM
jgi:hypothetical protein